MHWIKKNYYKIFNKNKYDIIKKSVENSKKVKYFNSFFCKEIFKIRKKIKDKKILNFSHSVQIGDIIYALPVIYALSKKHICNLYINLNKSNKFINFKTYKMLYPLLRYQPYLNKVEKLKNQKIDINFDLFRKFPFACYNLNKIFLELAGVHFNLDKKFIFAKKNKKFSNNIVIVRSLRRQNKTINYKILKKYKENLFIGLREEFDDIKKYVPNIKFYECNNFLDMCSIINSSKVFIGNQSFGFSLAEGLKVKRILELDTDGQDIIPFGKNGYDFYFQQDFENILSFLIKKINTA
jgi:hypothetical protein